MKNCELCNGLARMYCESDQANLCWDCDAKVHSANFLVARHSRSLLCRVCQSPTAWSATGAKIGRIVSACDRCVNNEGTGTEEEDDDDDDDDDEEEIDSEDVQVVPWSSTPPPPLSSSSNDESINHYGNVSLKRMREHDSDLHCYDDSEASSSHREVGTPPAAEASNGDEARMCINSISTRIRTPLKIQRTDPIRTGRVSTTRCAAAIMEFVGRINRQEMIQPSPISEESTVDLECSEIS